MITFRKEKKIFQVEFYKKQNGKAPVLEFLNALPDKLRAKAFRDIELLEICGNNLKEPHTKALKGKNNKGLYELRIKFSSDTVRIFYFMYIDNKYILLHGFVKKAMKIPETELAKARQYRDDYLRRNGSWAKQASLLKK